jgi:hypothetical protein
VYFSPSGTTSSSRIPSRISAELADFREALPLGLEDWMLESQCVLVVGDGAGLNYATTSSELHERLQQRFPPARR